MSAPQPMQLQAPSARRVRTKGPRLDPYTLYCRYCCNSWDGWPCGIEYCAAAIPRSGGARDIAEVTEEAWGYFLRLDAREIVAEIHLDGGMGVTSLMHWAAEHGTFEMVEWLASHSYHPSLYEEDGVRTYGGFLADHEPPLNDKNACAYRNCGGELPLARAAEHWYGGATSVLKLLVRDFPPALATLNPERVRSQLVIDCAIAYAEGRLRDIYLLCGLPKRRLDRRVAVLCCLRQLETDARARRAGERWGELLVRAEQALPRDIWSEVLAFI